MIYAWKRGVPADAQVVGATLERIEQRAGLVTPELLVTECGPKEHELHHLFTWNDREAAKLRRLDEARYILRSLVVKTPHDGEVLPVRAYLATSSEESEQAYYSLATIESRPDLSESVIEQVKRELRAVQAKLETLYDALHYLRPVSEHIGLALEGLTDRPIEAQPVA